VPKPIRSPGCCYRTRHPRSSSMQYIFCQMRWILPGSRRALVCVVAGALATLGSGCGSEHHKVAALSECPGEASYSSSLGCSSSHPSPQPTIQTLPESAPPAPRLPTVPNRSTKTYAASPRGIKKPSNNRPANGKRLGPKTLPASVVRAAPAVLALSKYRVPEPTEADLNAPAETLTPIVPAVDLRKSSALSSPALGSYAYRYPSGTTLYGSVAAPAHSYLYPGGSYSYCATAGSADCISGIPTASSASTSSSVSATSATSVDYAYQVPQSTGYFYTTRVESYVWVSVKTSAYYYVPSADASEFYWTPRSTQHGYYYQPPATQGYFWDSGGRNWSYYPERDSMAHYVANEGGLVGYVNEEAMYRYGGEGWQQVESDPELEEAPPPEETYPEEREEESSSGEQPPTPSEPETPVPPPTTETPPSTTPSTPEPSPPAPETTPQTTVPEPPPLPAPPYEPPPSPEGQQPPESNREEREEENTRPYTSPEEPFY
jgi:hypothetical protein